MGNERVATRRGREFEVLACLPVRRPAREIRARLAQHEGEHDLPEHSSGVKGGRVSGIPARTQPTSGAL